MDISRAWKTVWESSKIVANECLGCIELQQQKPWFDVDYSKLWNNRSRLICCGYRIKAQWKEVIWTMLRFYSSIHFTNKEKKYWKTVVRLKHTLRSEILEIVSLLMCLYLFLLVHVCYLQLQAHFLVLDDIMDGSETRRGRPCWYLYENLGTAAICDGLLLEQGLYQLLSRYFRDKPYYARVLELFHDVSLIFIP